MNDWFTYNYNILFKDLTFYFTIIKYIIYFFIGAFVLLLLNLIKNIMIRSFSFFKNIHSKEYMILNLKKLSKIILFIFTSIIIGIIVLN